MSVDAPEQRLQTPEVGFDLGGETRELTDYEANQEIAVKHANGDWEVMKLVSTPAKDGKKLLVEVQPIVRNAAAGAAPPPTVRMSLDHWPKIVDTSLSTLQGGRYAVGEATVTPEGRIERKVIDKNSGGQEVKQVPQELLQSWQKVESIQQKIDALKAELHKKILGRQKELQEKRIDTEKQLAQLVDQLPDDMEQARAYTRRAIDRFQSQFDGLYKKVEASMQAFEATLQEAESLPVAGEMKEKDMTMVESVEGHEMKKKIAEELEALVAQEEADLLKEVEQKILEDQRVVLDNKRLQWNSERDHHIQGWDALGRPDRKRIANDLLKKAKDDGLIEKGARLPKKFEEKDTVPELLAEDIGKDVLDKVRLSSADKKILEDRKRTARLEVIARVMKDFGKIHVADTPDRQHQKSFFAAVEAARKEKAAQEKRNGSARVSSGKQIDFKKSRNKSAVDHPYNVETALAFDAVLSDWKQEAPEALPEGAVEFGKEMDRLLTELNEARSHIPTKADGSPADGWEALHGNGGIFIEKVTILRDRLQSVDSYLAYAKEQARLGEESNANALYVRAYQAVIDGLQENPSGFLAEAQKKQAQRIELAVRMYGAQVQERLAKEGGAHIAAHADETIARDANARRLINEEHGKELSLDIRITGREMESLLEGRMEHLHGMLRGMVESLSVRIEGRQTFHVDGELTPQMLKQFEALFDGVQPTAEQEAMLAKAGIRNFEVFKQMWQKRLHQDVAKTYHEAAKDKMERKAAAKMFELQQMWKNWKADPVGVIKKTGQILATLGIVGLSMSAILPLVGTSVLGAIGASAIVGGGARHFLTKGLRALGKKFGSQESANAKKAGAVEETVKQELLNEMFGELQLQGTFNASVEGKAFKESLDGLPAFSAMVASAVRELSQQQPQAENGSEADLDAALRQLNMNEKILYHQALEQLREQHPSEADRIKLAQVLYEMRSKMKEVEGQDAYASINDWNQKALSTIDHVMASLYGGDPTPKGEAARPNRELFAAMVTSGAIAAVFRGGQTVAGTGAIRFGVGAGFGLAAGWKFGAEQEKRSDRIASREAIEKHMHFLRENIEAGFVDQLVDHRTVPAQSYLQLKRILHGTASSFEMAGVLQEMGPDKQMGFDTVLYTQIEDLVYDAELQLREVRDHSGVKQYQQLQDTLKQMGETRSAIEGMSKTKRALWKRAGARVGFMAAGAVIGGLKSFMLGEYMHDLMKPDEMTREEFMRESAKIAAAAGAGEAPVEEAPRSPETPEAKETPEASFKLPEAQNHVHLREVANVDYADDKVLLDEDGNRKLAEIRMGEDNVRGAEERAMRRLLEGYDFEGDGDKQAIIREWRQQLGIKYDGEGGEIRSHVAHADAKMVLYVDEQGNPGFKLVGDDDDITRFETARRYTYGDDDAAPAEGTSLKEEAEALGLKHYDPDISTEPVVHGEYEKVPDTPLSDAHTDMGEAMELHAKELAEFEADKQRFGVGGEDRGVAAGSTEPLDDASRDRLRADAAKMFEEMKNAEGQNKYSVEQLRELNKRIGYLDEQPATSAETIGRGWEDTAEKVKLSTSIVEQDGFKEVAVDAEEVRASFEELLDTLQDRVDHAHVVYDSPPEHHDAFAQKLDKLFQAMVTVESDTRLPSIENMIRAMEEQGVDKHLAAVAFAEVTEENPAVVKGGHFVKFVDDGVTRFYYDPEATFDRVQDGKIYGTHPRPDSLPDELQVLFVHEEQNPLRISGSGSVESQSEAGSSESELDAQEARVEAQSAYRQFGDARAYVERVGVNAEGQFKTPQDYALASTAMELLEAGNGYYQSDAYERDLIDMGIDPEDPAVASKMQEAREAHTRAMQHFVRGVGRTDSGSSIFSLVAREEPDLADYVQRRIGGADRLAAANMPEHAGAMANMKDELIRWHINNTYAEEIQAAKEEELRRLQGES